MERWRSLCGVVCGLMTLAWPLLACAQEPQVDRRGARKALEALALVPTKIAPMMLMSVATLDDPRYALFVSRPCLDALKNLGPSEPWPLPNVQRAASVCPRATQPLPPDLSLASTLLPPETLALVGGLVESLVVTAGADPPPTAPVMQRLVVGLLSHQQSTSKDWPTATSAEGLPTASVQAMNESIGACLRAELSFPGVEAPDLGRRVEIILHPAIEPEVSRADGAVLRACALEAAKKAPPPDGLARLIWVGPS